MVDVFGLDGLEGLAGEVEMQGIADIDGDDDGKIHKFLISSY